MLHQRHDEIFENNQSYSSVARGMRFHSKLRTISSTFEIGSFGMVAFHQLSQRRNHLGKTSSWNFYWFFSHWVTSCFQLENEFEKTHSKVVEECNRIPRNDLFHVPKCYRITVSGRVDFSFYALDFYCCFVFFCLQEQLERIIKRLKSTQFCDENDICEEARKIWESCGFLNELLRLVSIEKCLGLSR